jgi:hypothetical protein
MQSLTDWLSKPFNTDQNAYHWFLFVGLILIALILWGTIIKDVRGAI